MWLDFIKRYYPVFMYKREENAQFLLISYSKEHRFRVFQTLPDSWKYKKLLQVWTSFLKLVYYRDYLGKLWRNSKIHDFQPIFENYIEKITLKTFHKSERSITKRKSELQFHHETLKIANAFSLTNVAKQVKLSLTLSISWSFNFFHLLVSFFFRFCRPGFSMPAYALIGHFHDDNIWLYLPEFISFLLPYCRSRWGLKAMALYLHKKRTNWSILVVVVRWRNRVIILLDLYCIEIIQDR